MLSPNNINSCHVIISIFFLIFFSRKEGSTKERSMEKFVVFPFSLGCVSESSIPIANNNPKNSQLNHEVPTSMLLSSPHFVSFVFALLKIPTLVFISMWFCEVGEESPSKVKMNGFLVRRRLSQGMHTLKRNFKGFYQLFGK